MTRFFPCLLFLCFAAPAYAAESARPSFDHLNDCVKQHNLPACRNDATNASLPLYNRFASYGLAKCLPSDVRFVSEDVSGNRRLVHAVSSASGQDRAVRLVFAQENGQWKLDLPESLHLWLGDNWQQRVNGGEQLYLMLHQQLGDKLDCQSARALVK